MEGRLYRCKIVKGEWRKLEEVEVRKTEERRGERERPDGGKRKRE